MSILWSLLCLLHPDGGEGFLGEAACGLSHDAGVAQGPGQQHWPPDEVRGQAHASHRGVHSDHRDVEQLLSLELVKQVQVLGAELPVNGKVGLEVGIDSILDILKTGF